MDKLVYTVSQLNNYIKGIIDDDFVLNNIHVEAEISNFKAHSSGHMYFTIKDEYSAMSAVMFRSAAQRLKFTPENGLKVSIYGYISVYEKTGQYQLYAEIMEPSGIGSLYLEYERLKERLEKVGLFDQKHKKAIPPFPKCVAVITSPTGAAVRDVIRISKRRNPNVRLVVVPALVQGMSAGDDIVRAIKEVNLWGKADVIILGRGGGSIEDLWAFNEEKVARAVFESEIPIISAVGHETDFTITDFIADLRASTPSAAAELAVPEMKGMTDKLLGIDRRLENAFNKKFLEAKNRYNLAISAVSFKRFPQKIYETEIYVENLEKRLNNAMLYKKDNIKNRFLRARDKLEAISPVNILKRGYSLAYDKDNRVIKSSSQVDCGDKIRLVLDEGEIQAEVIKKD